MQNIRPSALTDKELFHYAGQMVDEDKTVPPEWIKEMVDRYFSGKLRVPAPRFQD